MALAPRNPLASDVNAQNRQAAGDRARLSTLNRARRAYMRGDIRAGQSIERSLKLQDEMAAMGAPVGATRRAEDITSIAGGRLAAQDALIAEQQRNAAMMRQMRENFFRPQPTTGTTAAFSAGGAGGAGAGAGAAAATGRFVATPGGGQKWVTDAVDRPQPTTGPSSTTALDRPQSTTGPAAMPVSTTPAAPPAATPAAASTGRFVATPGGGQKWVTDQPKTPAAAAPSATTPAAPPAATPAAPSATTPAAAPPTTPAAAPSATTPAAPPTEQPKIMLADITNPDYRTNPMTYGDYIAKGGSLYTEAGKKTLADTEAILSKPREANQMSKSLTSGLRTPEQLDKDLEKFKPAPFTPSPPTAAELKTAADEARYQRLPGLTKVGIGAKNLVTSAVTGATNLVTKQPETLLPPSVKGIVQVARGVNEMAPSAVSAVTGAIESAGNTMMRGIESGAAPARNWLAGSEQKSKAELAYEATLKNPRVTPRAMGGPVKAGSPYLVGEEGPELVVPKTAEKPFIPDSVARGILGLVDNGARFYQGLMGAANMMTEAEIKAAEELLARRKAAGEPAFVPIAERYKGEPWYTQMGKQIRDAFSVTPNEVAPFIAEETLPAKKAVASFTDNEFNKTARLKAKYLTPEILGTEGQIVSKVAQLIPGQRALSPVLDAGESRSLPAGIPAAAATLLIPGKGKLTREIYQEGLSDLIKGAASAAQPFVVGEEGPEIVVPAKDGTVIPAEQTQELLKKKRREMLMPKSTAKARG
jgi:hypothetical protein